MKIGDILGNSYATPTDLSCRDIKQQDAYFIARGKTTCAKSTSDLTMHIRCLYIASIHINGYVKNRVLDQHTLIFNVMAETMIKAVALDDLARAMANTRSTNKWDLVASYTLGEINNCLAEKHQDSKRYQFKVAYSGPLIPKNSFVLYDIKLSAPRIRFTLDDKVELIQVIGSGSAYSVEQNGKVVEGYLNVPIPENKYALIVNTGLAYFDGTTQGFTKQETPYLFHGAEDEVHVVLHLGLDTGSTIAILPMIQGEDDVQYGYTLPEEDQHLQAYALSGLKDFFLSCSTDAVNSLVMDYTLGAVKYPKTESEVILIPESFFAKVIKSSDSPQTKSTLSLYIKVKGTENSGDPYQTTCFKVEQGADLILPIPENYTASVILSIDLIYKLILEPAFKKEGYKCSLHNVGEKDGGVLIQLTHKEDAVCTDPVTHSCFGPGLRAVDRYDPIRMPISADQPIKLTILHTRVKIAREGKAESSWSQGEMLQSY